VFSSRILSFDLPLDLHFAGFNPSESTEATTTTMMRKPIIAATDWREAIQVSEPDAAVRSLLRLLHLLGASSFLAIAIAIAIACESPVNCRRKFLASFSERLISRSKIIQRLQKNQKITTKKSQFSALLIDDHRLNQLMNSIDIESTDRSTSNRCIHRIIGF
jgi:hypothetical protein